MVGTWLMSISHKYISAMAFLSSSIIVRVDVLAASTSMDIDVFADDARGTVVPTFTNNA